MTSHGLLFVVVLVPETAGDQMLFANEEWRGRLLILSLIEALPTYPYPFSDCKHLKRGASSQAPTRLDISYVTGLLIKFLEIKFSCIIPFPDLFLFGSSVGALEPM